MANAIVSVCPGKTHGHGIAEYCRNVDADLVILGSKGQTNLKYVLLGSTVESLLKEIQLFRAGCASSGAGRWVKSRGSVQRAAY